MLLRVAVSTGNSSGNVPAVPRPRDPGNWDGGNDVGMLQEADVGVNGRKGPQAAQASDFAVVPFKH
jgi:hypothetical protein